MGMLLFICGMLLIILIPTVVGTVLIDASVQHHITGSKTKE